MLVFTILIILFTLIALMALHEFGHFIIAKKFGVEIEEFGIGYPPRLFGKKIGETVYSLNLLPFGAFVRIVGEEERVNHPRSFSQKSIGRRALILLAGVISFWIIAFILLMIILPVWGVPASVADDETAANLFNHRVQVAAVQDNSPAEIAGIESGDNIIRVKSSEEELEIDKVADFHNFVLFNEGKEVAITLQRGSEIFQVLLTPRPQTEEEGSTGVLLLRVADLKYPWYQSPYRSAVIVAKQTVRIPSDLVFVLGRLIKGEEVVGAEVMGVVGIGQRMGRSLDYSLGSFLSFVAMISIWLAIFNLLPIPALDGGRLLFLAIEGVRRKPMSQKIEQKLNAAFMFLLIGLMIFVTIKDVVNLF